MNMSNNGNFSRPGEFCPVVCTWARVDFNGHVYWVMVDEDMADSNYNKDYGKFFKMETMMPEEKFLNNIVKFSYCEDGDYDSIPTYTVYTNLRTLVNAKVPYDEIPFISKIYYKQYGENKDNLFIVIGTEKTSIYDINVNYETKTHDKDMPLIFKIKDLLEAGYTYKDIIKDFNDGHCYVDNRYKYFKAIKLKIPMFVWSQWPMTHTALSKESQSDRVAEGVGYWLPEGIINKINEASEEEIDKINFAQEFIDLQAITSSSDTPAAAKIEYILNSFLNGYPQECVQQILKAAGYKREIWSRAPYYFKYKECVITGWYNDPTTWQHSFLERSTEPEVWKNWTQKETKEVVQAVKEIVERK